ncbi:MAG: YlxM family DNA-binding protein [Lachnospiraceae bacterium]|jgi:predicted DNA-binding protein YlxM (UPF0122 family)|nr:YlxM family DNA-binding protein [Lachnospiraceae bacterium]
MEKIVWQGMLYDFYGELLTAHQKQVYEDVVLHDLSLGEIADKWGITRQGAHDCIRRCDGLLAGYEEKLQLVSKFYRAKGKVTEIERELADYRSDGDGAHIGRIEELAGEIREVL